MKYKTFRALLIAGGSVLAVSGCGLLSWWCGSSVPRPVVQASPVAAPEPRPAALPAAAPTATAASPASAPLAAGETPLRPMDREILARADQPISGDKVKDAIPGRSYKVNLYQDPGETRINRLKVDLDRDEKWDEKWTFSRGKDEVKRQVSPADDDTSYTEEYRLRGDVWVRKYQN